MSSAGAVTVQKERIQQSIRTSSDPFPSQPELEHHRHLEKLEEYAALRVLCARAARYVRFPSLPALLSVQFREAGRGAYFHLHFGAAAAAYP